MAHEAPVADGRLSVTTYRLSTAVPHPVLHLYLQTTAVVPQPALALSSASSYEAYALTPQTSRPVALTLHPQPASDGCAFWEIDRQLMPGLYALQPSPPLIDHGWTFVRLTFEGVHPHYLKLHGVAYNPHDAFALGLNTWMRGNCHEHLTSGLRKSMPTTLRPLLQDWLQTQTQ